MRTILKKLQSEMLVIAALAQAVFLAAEEFGFVDWNEGQLRAAMGVVTATLLLIRWLATPPKTK